VGSFLKRTAHEAVLRVDKTIVEGKTPPESPATIALAGRLLLPSRFSTLSASGCVTRLNRTNFCRRWSPIGLQTRSSCASSANG
jgi:hypothetical protein